MKDIMAKESSWSEGGTPSYGCSPKPKEASIFDSLDPVPELADELLTSFAGRTAAVAAIYLEHGLERLCTPGQYKDALKLLEVEGKVVATPPTSLRREGTMADHVKIQFPQKGV